MRFKRFTFSLLSPLVGVHVGKNPVSGQRFAHIAPVPFLGLDLEFGPSLNDAARERLREPEVNPAHTTAYALDGLAQFGNGLRMAMKYVELRETLRDLSGTDLGDDSRVWQDKLHDVWVESALDQGTESP